MVTTPIKITKSITLKKFTELDFDSIVQQYPILFSIYTLYQDLVEEQKRYPYDKKNYWDPNRDIANKLSIRVSKLKQAAWYIVKELLEQEK